MRKKLTIDEQVDYLKNNMGVKFNLISEKDAHKYLSKNTYFFKIKSFAKNYEVYNTGASKGKYMHLEFAYLQELARLDMHLRKFIINITLDIEHFLKTKLLKDISHNQKEDGYSIVNEFFKLNTQIERNIKKHISSYCNDLLIKYSDKLSVWILIELLSFGDFIELYEYYYNKYPEDNSLNSFLLPVKCLRNAAAHNNCILNSLRKPYSKKINENKKITIFISRQVQNISPLVRKQKMTNPVMHDFVTTLYVFDKIVNSKSTKKRTYDDLKELFYVKLIRNKDFFAKNDVIVSYYNFAKKIVDYFVKK